MPQKGMALGFLLPERSSVGPRRDVCRTMWGNGEFGGGGVPWVSHDMGLTIRIIAASKLSRSPL